MNPASILIVDDTPANLRLLTEVLSRAGYRVRSAISGALALSGAIAQPPDLVLLDIMMPDMNGYEVCQHLKANARTRDVPVVFLSALEEAADKVRAFEVGGVDYISKPFQKAEVLARVENQLSLRRLQAQLSEQNQRLQAEIGERAIAQQQLQRFSSHLKQLHRLDTRTYHSAAERYADYLKTGCQLLELEAGWLSRCESNRWYIEAQHNATHESLPVVQTLTNPDGLAVDVQPDAVAALATDCTSCHPTQIDETQQFSAYLGTPIWVNEQLYGTLAFASRARAEAAAVPRVFAAQECEIVELMAQSLGQFIAARQAKLKRQQAEEETRLLLAVTRAIAEAPDFATALAVALEQVSVASAWDYAEVWLPDPTAQYLTCAPVWYSRDREALAEFRHRSLQATRRRHEGLVGRVWVTATLEFIGDLSAIAPDAQIRHAAIADCGFGAELGVPILAAAEAGDDEPSVLAVLIFFRHREKRFASAEIQQRSVDLAATIAAQLGTVLQQKQVAAEQSAIFTAMTDLVLVRDQQGRCLKVMPTQTDSLVRHPAEMLGKTLHETWPPAQADILLAATQTALETQAKQDIEYSIERQGQMLWLAASISPLDRDRVILVARDISERKQREEALQLIAKGTAETTGNDFFRACARALAQALNVDCVSIGRRVDAESASVKPLAFWNRQAFGREDAYELTGTPDQLVLAGEEQFWAQGIGAEFPTDPNLSELGIEGYWGVPLRDSDERAIGHIALMSAEPMQRDRQANLTLGIFAARAGAELERKLAAEALRASEERNRAILSAIPDLMFRINRDGIYLGYVKTREFSDLLPNDFDPVGRHIREFLPPTLVMQHLKNLHKALISGVPQVYEQEVRINGRLQYEEVRIVVSGPDEALFIIRDVSDRKRAEMALRVAQQKSESLLLNILPRPIAERLKQQPGAIAEQFDEATILFADIVGFTPLAAQMSPIEVVNLLNQIFSEFDRLAERFNLEKIKTIGDAYMAVGGVPTPRADHAIAVAEMALAMQAAIARINPPYLQELRDGQPLQMRVGIHTGSVVAGVIGAKKFIYDLWGDAVNIASRMESQGLPGRIQIAATTFEQLDNRFQCERRGEVVVRGRGAMATYWLLASQPAATEPLALSADTNERDSA